MGGNYSSLTPFNSKKSKSMIYVSQIDELTKEVVKLIEASEGRSRSRTANEQLRFNHVVHVFLTDLWKAVKSTPIRECSINKRSGWYSENPRYRDPLLTYKQMIAVFDYLRLASLRSQEKATLIVQSIKARPLALLLEMNCLNACKS
jgi:glycogen debranching enzyme